MNTVDTALSTVDQSLQPTGESVVNGLRLINEGMREGLIESVKDRMVTQHACRDSFKNETQRKAFDAELAKYGL